MGLEQGKTSCYFQKSEIFCFVNRNLLLQFEFIFSFLSHAYLQRRSLFDNTNIHFITEVTDFFSLKLVRTCFASKEAKLRISTKSG